MAISFGIEETDPLVNPLTWAVLNFYGDGTSTSITVPFAQYPFSIPLNVKNSPSAIKAGGVTGLTYVFDPTTLNCEFTFPSSFAFSDPQNVNIQFLYSGV